MKKIEALIRPDRLDRITDALADAGFPGLNVSQATGHGTDEGILVGGPRGIGSHRLDMVPKVKLEVVVSDDDTERVIDVVRENAHTGTIGDGRIFVSQVNNAIRIRTGEEGDVAL